VSCGVQRTSTPRHRTLSSLATLRAHHVAPAVTVHASASIHLTWAPTRAPVGAPSQSRQHVGGRAFASSCRRVEEVLANGSSDRHAALQMVRSSGASAPAAALASGGGGSRRWAWRDAEVQSGRTRRRQVGHRVAASAASSGARRGAPPGTSSGGARTRPGEVAKVSFRTLGVGRDPASRRSTPRSERSRWRKLGEQVCGS